MTTGFFMIGGLMNSTTLRIAGPLVLAGLALAACSSPPTEVASANAVPEPTPVVEAPPPTTWAMTGLPDKQDGRQRPILAVKLDNTSSSWPQVGVDAADLVVQEPVEGGATRLAAFYESDIPKSVGPVRSIRTSDLGFVKPADATLVASGGSPIALAAARRAKITVIEEGTTGFYRESGRAAPYNLMADLKQIARDVKAAGPVDPYLAFGDFVAPAGKTTKSVGVSFSPSSGEQWQYRRATDVWTRTGNGGDFDAKSLVILSLEVGDAGYLDPAGNPVPEMRTTGSGTGWLVVGSKIHKIRWSKPSARATWTLTTRQGAELNVPAGNSWVSLIPDTTGSVQVG